MKSVKEANVQLTVPKVEVGKKEPGAFLFEAAQIITIARLMGETWGLSPGRDWL